jgi:predicted HAD superfamily phosphohydrolase YqeG
LEGITAGWQYRYQLRQLIAETPATTRLLDREPQELAAAGVQALALDFDGVLAPHGADQPLPEVVGWLRRAVVVFGAERIVVLSNRPFGPRVNWFAEQFPGLRFVSGVRKKPYPDGLIKTGELISVPLSSILMVDDRLLTGCLSALLAGARPYYVYSPYRSFRANLRKELFFQLLRRCERTFCRLTTLF